jgi:radical SAM protein with 4Fe4S-binding SPASM domain
MRAKTALLNRWGGDVLRAFGAMRGWPVLAGAFSRFSREVVGPYLYSLKIELNTVCDLECRMCYVPPGARELPLGLVQEILRQLRGTKTRVELLGGEPLLRDDCEEIVAYARRTCGLPFVSLYTNGMRATARRAARLREAGLSAAIVSLISPDRERHDRFTGKSGSFDSTIRGIRALRDAGVPVYTFTAVHAENAGDIAALVRMVKGDLGAHALFYPYIPQVPDDPLMIDPRQWYGIKRAVLNEYAPGHMAFVRDFFMLTGCACSGGNFVLTVKADGSIQPCPFVNDIPLGSIFSKSIWEIHRERYRSPALRTFKALPEECRACSHASICGGGCRAGNRMLLGSYGRRDMRCRGPYQGAIDTDSVMDRLPCFF